MATFSVGLINTTLIGHLRRVELRKDIKGVDTPLGACAHHCCTSKELVVLRDHTNHVCGVAVTVYRRKQGPHILAESLIVKTAGSIQERLAARHIGDPLAHGEGPRLSTELPDWELGPCVGFLARGSNED